MQIIPSTRYIDFSWFSMKTWGGGGKEGGGGGGEEGGGGVGGGWEGGEGWGQIEIPSFQLFQRLQCSAQCSGHFDLQNEIVFKLTFQWS